MTTTYQNLSGRLWRDLRYAVRRLVAKPAFTVTAILSLALGIGANAALFTLVNELIFRRAPVMEPEQLVKLYSSRTNAPFDAMTYPDLADLARETGSIFSGFATTTFNMVPTDAAGTSERVVIEMLSTDFFRVLGLRPQLGRLFDSTDAPGPGAGMVVVLGDSYWRRTFGGRSDVIGKTIRLAGQPYQIIGVAPTEYPGSFRGLPPALFVPITVANFIEADGDFFTNRSNAGTFGTARLRPGVTMEQARIAVGNVVAEFRQRWPGDWPATRAISLLPSADVIIHPPIDRVLVPVAWMLMVVVGLVLVVACANLAAFLLARAVDRRKEIAVRLALGATRRQLVSQLLAEAFVLSLLGGGLGILLGQAALRAILASDLPLPIPLGLDLTLDWRVLTFTVVMSLVAGLVFGLAPALKSTRLELASVIRDETAGGGRHKGRARGVLLGGQVAVTVVLLIAAGLFARSFDVARRVEPGFPTQPTAAVWLGLPNTRSAAQTRLDFERIAQRLRAMPSVEAVGFASQIHLNTLTTSSQSILVDGVAPPPGETSHAIDVARVDTGFVSALGLELEAGRGFRAEDLDSTARVAIVNEAFASRFWPGQDPIGRRFRHPSGREVTVIGLVNTVKIRTLAEPPRPFIYAPIEEPSWVYWVMVRTRRSAEAAMPEILATIREADPESFVIDARTMERHLAIMSLPLRLGAMALGGFALLALVIASVGLYGSVSYAVARRAREVGIRLSLGADRRSVVGLLLWSGLRLVLVGLGVGLAISLAAMRLLEGLLFGVHALDPLTFLAVPVILLLVAGMAAWLPARRAGAVNPIQALRSSE